MKKIILSVFLVVLFSSCSNTVGYRTVTVAIAQHPWEENTKAKMWYTLRWTDGDKIQSLYVDQNTRQLSVKIPLGQTVYISASPLGEMEAFGCAITPVNHSTFFVLSQNEGLLTSLLMEQEASIRKNINFDMLVDACYSKTEDFRNIDQVDLLTDILNGNLSKDSIKTAEKIKVEPINVLDGVWISQNSLDDTLNITNSKTPQLNLSPGIYRYYCHKLQRELRITIDYDGTLHAFLYLGLL